MTRIARGTLSIFTFLPRGKLHLDVICVPKLQRTACAWQLGASQSYLHNEA